ncbi:unnamed protein product [Notodromas monacha]|uniref:M-phase inducer phosphatase n=1 Tax=Notodromas monacha TaxID=399045 RepID=A0A7R9BY13_9CRUS|nr:unnamed protein product [Notodromas monacha]CAG0922756.1 unnamed protein product [Notodromas monacha]
MPPCVAGMVSRSNHGIFRFPFSCSSRSPRKLDFAVSHDDSKDHSDDQMEVSGQEDMSPECRALLSPLQPDNAARARVKRKFPGGSPGLGLFAHVSPYRAKNSPRVSPSKRTKLSFGGQGQENQMVGCKVISGLGTRPPLRTIQKKADHEFTPPVGLPPKRLTSTSTMSPFVSRLTGSPVVMSPCSSSSDGFSELLLDEDANLPPSSPPSSAASLCLNSLLMGSILSLPKPQGAVSSSSSGTNQTLDAGYMKKKTTTTNDSMDTEDVVSAKRKPMTKTMTNAAAAASTSSNNDELGFRGRVPLRRALSYAGGTPQTSGTKSARSLFGTNFDNDGSPLLTSRAKKAAPMNDENAPPSSQSTGVHQSNPHSTTTIRKMSSMTTSSSVSLSWDTESCPAPLTKLKRLSSVVEEDADATATMPPDLSGLRERCANVPLAHFKSDSNFSLAARAFRRSTSDTHAIINRALNRSEKRPDLIADCSRPYCLPFVTEGVKHPDLKNITPDTLNKVLRGDYKNVITTFTVIDCRFPYEFDGGHVVGAVNIYTKDQILKEILPNEPCIAPAVSSGSGGGGNHLLGGCVASSSSSPASSTSGSGSDSTPDSSPDNDGKGTHKERNILIFHCEFSSERGPSLLRFLRNRDRGLNANNYPALHFPELYLLDGGYKAFYERYPHQCTPIAYKTMLDPNHMADLRHFKAKAKTWSGDAMATAAKSSVGGSRRKAACRKQFL